MITIIIYSIFEMQVIIEAHITYTVYYIVQYTLYIYIL